MTRTLRNLLSVVAAVCFVPVTAGSVLAQTHEVGHWAGIWSITQMQFLRTCLSARSPQLSSADRPREEVAFYFTEIKNQLGEVILETELAVPSGEFRCADVSYNDLVREGLEPDTTTDTPTIKFSMNIHTSGQFNRTETVGANQSISVGANKTRNVGAVMVVGSETGKAELYEPLRGSYNFIVE